MSKLQAIELLLDSARGIYIPRDFVEGLTINDEFGWRGITEEHIKTLSNPDNEGYWEAWDEVLNNAKYISKCGKEYILHQDGDLFAIYLDELTETQRINLGWEL